MIGSRYLLGLAWRLALLILAALAFAATLARPDLGATRVVAALVVIGAGALLLRHVTRTNRELARFIDAVRFADFSQGFIHRFEGSGFSELGRVLDGAMKRLRDDKHKLIDANRFYEAVLDDAPTALLTVDGEGRVELANKAARRLLVRHKGVRVDEFRVYGDAFVRALEGGSIGRPRLVPLVSDGVPQTMLVSGAIVHRLGGLVRVVAVQPIQGELNAIEIAAQSDLIRVLTHEIMNSMTPVTSLAHSAAALMRAADKGADRDVADARVRPDDAQVRPRFHRRRDRHPHLATVRLRSRYHRVRAERQHSAGRDPDRLPRREAERSARTGQDVVRDREEHGVLGRRSRGVVRQDGIAVDRGDRRDRDVGRHGHVGREDAARRIRQDDVERCDRGGHRENGGEVLLD